MEYFSKLMHSKKKEFKKILTILTHESQNARLQGLCALFAIATYSPGYSPQTSPNTSPSCRFTSEAYHSPRATNSHVGDWSGEHLGEYVGEYLIFSNPLSIGLSALLGEYGEGLWSTKGIGAPLHRLVFYPNSSRRASSSPTTQMMSPLRKARWGEIDERFSSPSSNPTTMQL